MMSDEHVRSDLTMIDAILRIVDEQSIMLRPAEPTTTPQYIITAISATMYAVTGNPWFITLSLASFFVSANPVYSVDEIANKFCIDNICYKTKIEWTHNVRVIEHCQEHYTNDGGTFYCAKRRKRDLHHTEQQNEEHKKYDFGKIKDYLISMNDTSKYAIVAASAYASHIKFPIIGPAIVIGLYKTCKRFQDISR